SFGGDLPVDRLSVRRRRRPRGGRRSAGRLRGRRGGPPDPPGRRPDALPARADALEREPLRAPVARDPTDASPADDAPRGGAATSRRGRTRFLSAPAAPSTP